MSPCKCQFPGACRWLITSESCTFDPCPKQKSATQLTMVVKLGGVEIWFGFPDTSWLLKFPPSSFTWNARASSCDFRVKVVLCLKYLLFPFHQFLLQRELVKTALHHCATTIGHKNSERCVVFPEVDGTWSLPWKISHFLPQDLLSSLTTLVKDLVAWKLPSFALVNMFYLLIFSASIGTSDLWCILDIVCVHGVYDTHKEKGNVTEISSN